VCRPHTRHRLAEKIRAARVNKERSLQLQEKARLTAQEAEYDKTYDTVSVYCIVSCSAVCCVAQEPAFSRPPTSIPRCADVACMRLCR
jgi:hypothetical protein